MPGTRGRIPSKQPACRKYTKTTGENWLNCEKCESWTHSACMGYSREEFQFLEKSPNVVFLCNLCLPDAQKNLQSEKPAPEVLKDVADLKQTVEAVKTMVGTLMQGTKSPPILEAKYPEVVKTTNDYALEVRFSGIPELKTSKIENQASGTKNKKPYRKEIFEHDESLLNEVTDFLGVNPAEISSFRRLGRFNAEASRPRTILVKFTHALTVDKILARSAMLKTYEPSFDEQKYLVFVSKSLNKEDQLKEQKVLRKRRQILNSGTVDPKDVKIRNGMLLVNNKPVDLDD